MTRLEARTVFAAAIALVVAGLTWLFGPYGLIGAGVVLGGLVLFVDVKEQDEVLADPAPPRGDLPVQHRPVRR